LGKTDIGYREIAQCQFIIKGNSYFNTVGIFTYGQFYNYADHEILILGAATRCGYDFGNIYVFHYNNVVYLWFTQQPTTDGNDSYMTFEVYVSTNVSQENRVVEIAHSPKPTSGVTNEITISPSGIYAGDSSKLGGVAASSYATKDDIANGNITAAKATTADSANAIGGKGLSDLVQGGGTIKFIKVVTSLPASPSSDTLYLIK
jgi:hypothetical protein